MNIALSTGLTGYARTYCNTLTLIPLSIHFLLYLARGVMNSLFWKMGITKNSLLLLFVPGSSRASVRSTATDDREDLASPLSLSFFVLLLHLSCSPCTSTWHSTLFPLNLHFLKLLARGTHWCLCTALFWDHLSVSYWISVVVLLL